MKVQNQHRQNALYQRLEAQKSAHSNANHKKARKRNLFQKRVPIEIVFEHCINCDLHNWCFRHNEQKYLENYQQLSEKIQQLFERNQIRYRITQNVLPQNYRPLQSIQKSNREYSNDIQGNQIVGKFFDTVTQEIVHFPRLGAFEITFEGVVIFSKLICGHWPNHSKILKTINQMIQQMKGDQQFSHSPEKQQDYKAALYQEQIMSRLKARYDVTINCETQRRNKKTNNLNQYTDLLQQNFRIRQQTIKNNIVNSLTLSKSKLSRIEGSPKSRIEPSPKTLEATKDKILYLQEMRRTIHIQKLNGQRKYAQSLRTKRNSNQRYHQQKRVQFSTEFRNENPESQLHNTGISPILSNYNNQVQGSKRSRLNKINQARKKIIDAYIKNPSNNVEVYLQPLLEQRKGRLPQAQYHFSQTLKTKVQEIKIQKNRKTNLRRGLRVPKQNKQQAQRNSFKPVKNQQEDRQLEQTFQRHRLNDIRDLEQQDQANRQKKPQKNHQKKQQKVTKNTVAEVPKPSQPKQVQIKQSSLSQALKKQVISDVSITYNLIDAQNKNEVRSNNLKKQQVKTKKPQENRRKLSFSNDSQLELKYSLFSEHQISQSKKQENINAEMNQLETDYQVQLQNMSKVFWQARFIACQFLIVKKQFMTQKNDDQIRKSYQIIKAEKGLCGHQQAIRHPNGYFNTPKEHLKFQNYGEIAQVTDQKQRTSEKSQDSHQISLFVQEIIENSVQQMKRGVNQHDLSLFIQSVIIDAVKQIQDEDQQINAFVQRTIFNAVKYLQKQSKLQKKLEFQGQQQLQKKMQSFNEVQLKTHSKLNQDLKQNQIQTKQQMNLQQIHWAAKYTFQNEQFSLRQKSFSVDHVYLKSNSIIQFQEESKLVQQLQQKQQKISHVMIPSKSQWKSKNKFQLKSKNNLQELSSQTQKGHLEEQYHEEIKQVQNANEEVKWKASYIKQKYQLNRQKVFVPESQDFKPQIHFNQ